MFKVEKISDTMKESVLILLNKIKHQLSEPEFMNLCHIISIYKGKGERSSLESDRGIFILNTVRMIKDRLILNDIKDTVDKNMSPSQVGARPNKGTRNHLFVLYQIMNSVLQKESPPVDLSIYDVKKCF